MLRVFKPTSPMSVGSWLLAGYGPVAGAAAVSEVTGILPKAGTAATSARAARPAMATYTAALICDTAVPAWHAGHREMPYVFAGSAASAAGGLGLLATRPATRNPPVTWPSSAPRSNSSPSGSWSTASPGLPGRASRSRTRPGPQAPSCGSRSS